MIFSFAEAMMPLVSGRRTPGVRLLQDIVYVWVAMNGRDYGPLLDTLSADAIGVVNMFAVPERLVLPDKYVSCEDEEEGLAFRDIFVITEGRFVNLFCAVSCVSCVLCHVCCVSCVVQILCRVWLRCGLGMCVVNLSFCVPHTHNFGSYLFSRHS